MKEKIKKEEKISDEKEMDLSFKIATLIKPILFHIQLLMKEIPIEDMEHKLEILKDITSTQEAFPFPQTLNQADLNKKKNKVFKCIIDLMKAEKEMLNHENQYITEKELKEIGLLL